MYGEFINTKLCEITGELYKMIDAEIEGAIQPIGCVRFTVKSKLPPWTCEIKLTTFCSLPVDELAQIVYRKYRKYIESQFLKR